MKYIYKHTLYYTIIGCVGQKTRRLTSLATSAVDIDDLGSEGSLAEFLLWNADHELSSEDWFGFGSL